MGIPTADQARAKRVSWMAEWQVPGLKGLPEGEGRKERRKKGEKREDKGGK